VDGKRKHVGRYVESVGAIFAVFNPDSKGVLDI
jgi:hypothetical protein